MPRLGPFNITSLSFPSTLPSPSSLPPLPYYLPFHPSLSQFTALFVIPISAVVSLPSVLPLLSPLAMGVLKLWPFIKEQGYIAALKAFPTIPPPNTQYHIDILGSFFSVIRRCFLHPDTTVACVKFEQHLISCLFPKSTTILHMDGPSPAEKNATNINRQSKRDKALTKGNQLLTIMEETLNNHGKLRKQQFKTLNKAIVDSFYLTHELRQALVQHLRASGWTVCGCCSEADTCIGANCKKDDVVITRDSDALVYSNINTIWRPFGRDRYLVYHVSDLLRQLELSRTGLTTLGIVTQNDYGKGVHKMGVKGNFKVIRALETEGKAKYIYSFVLVPCPFSTHISLTFFWLFLFRHVKKCECPRAC